MDMESSIAPEIFDRRSRLALAFLGGVVGSCTVTLAARIGGNVEPVLEAGLGWATAAIYTYGASSQVES